MEPRIVAVQAFDNSDTHGVWLPEDAVYAARQAYDRGEIELVQRKTAPGRYELLALAHPRPVKRREGQKLGKRRVA